MLVKVVLHVSSTGCNNEWQIFCETVAISFVCRAFLHFILFYILCFCVQVAIKTVSKHKVNFYCKQVQHHTDIVHELKSLQFYLPNNFS